jgi:hypothetical protein
MLAEYVSREQRIADLEIHGWSPVRDGPQDARRYHGIWNDALQVGFGLSRSMAGARVIRLDPEWGRGGHIPCTWDELTDRLLDAIDARLAET